ncbi:unnamed protein product [Lymnaea stagnalis]|uniref:Dol-P-Glc:Glc(2)Man(9)GlcNAc(2)-PP-Dol alpha-1,2-glucosyltransferase n=1 Tax=Lymnaea stagnalis TaxID=6523 RepID=A0AAV2H4D4_LYMST
MEVVLISTLSIVLFVSGAIFQFIQQVQKEPYMDEIFHVPQAQQYCSFNFTSWNPMITTLPGLYLSSLILIFPLASFYGGSLSEFCTTQNLRACNIAFCTGNFILLFLLCRKLNDNNKDKNVTERQVLLNSVVLVLFPVLYFFTWLYYTDPGATFFTLLMYIFCLYRQHGVAAGAGLIAIVFRQTNVIWVLFCLCQSAIKVLDKEMQLHSKVNLQTLEDYEYFKAILSILNPSSIVRLAKNLLMTSHWYFYVIFGFIGFIIINKGIVVGDRSHHQASYNFPQVFYFLFITCSLSFFHFIHLSQINRFLHAAKNNPFRVLLFIGLSALLIKFFTYEHKYLLSDNRHYPFYVWSKFYKRLHIVRYIMIPVYMYCLYQIYKMTVHRGLLWRLTVSLCIVMCLVPQALLEFRYYIIPFYIIRVNMKMPSIRVLSAELLFYVCINAFTILMFVYRPFYWPDDPKPQRFMW